MVDQAIAEFPAKLAPLFEPHRYKVLRGGRGSAKSWSVARALLIEGARETPLRVLCTREYQNSIRDSVHALLCDQIESMNLGYYYTVRQAEILARNGGQILFTGLSDQTAESIKSYEGIQRVWCEEARTITERSYQILLPTVFRRPDSEVWITFNPELDTDPTYRRFVADPPPDCVSIEMNWRDNPWFGANMNELREHDLRVAEASGDMEDYLCIWEGRVRSAVQGAIYAREVAAAVESGRIRAVPYDPQLRVHTVWDLGWNDQTSVIFAQRVASEVRIIDYLEDSYRAPDWWAGQLEKKGYRYGSHWLPPDAKQSRFEASGKSTQQLLAGMGIRAEIIPDLGVEPGIKAARVMWPRVYLDKDRAGRLLECLKRYRRAIGQATQEPNKPLHDEYSHGADAYRYLACVVDKLTNDGPNWKPIKYDTRWVT